MENILLDINEKIKNRHTFTWKWWFGWLVAIPFILVGGIFIANSSYYNQTNKNIGIFIIFLGFLMTLKNWIQAFIALYKSTKNSKEVKKLRAEKILDKMNFENIFKAIKFVYNKIVKLIKKEK